MPLARVERLEGGGSPSADSLLTLMLGVVLGALGATLTMCACVHGCLRAPQSSQHKAMALPFASRRVGQFSRPLGEYDGAEEPASLVAPSQSSTHHGETEMYELNDAAEAARAAAKDCPDGVR